MSLAAFTFTARARPFVEIGVGDSRIARPAAVWDVQRWDEEDAFWAGDEPWWRDVTCDVRHAECQYGRSSSTDRFVVGTATVLVDNSSGWADPNNDEEPGVLTLRPGRAVRFGVDHAVYGRRVLFRGFIDRMNPTYAPVAADTVELNCIDALGEANRAKFVEMETPLYAGDTASSRVWRVLQLVTWPSSKQIIDPSSVTLIASNMGGQAADLLGVIAESSGGAVYGDTEGNIRYRGRDWQAWEADTPPDATIGNVEPGDVCPSGWQRPYDRADIATRVIVGRDGDEGWQAIMVDDQEGQVRFGIEPFTRTYLLTESDFYLDQLARRILQTRSWRYSPRVRSVMLDARTGDAALDLMTLADPYLPTRYRCRLTEDRGLVFDEQYLTTGVTHVLEDTQWVLSMSLDNAAPYVIGEGSAFWDWSGWDRSRWVDAVETAALAGVPGGGA